MGVKIEKFGSSRGSTCDKLELDCDSKARFFGGIIGELSKEALIEKFEALKPIFCKKVQSRRKTTEAKKL